MLAAAALRLLPTGGGLALVEPEGLGMQLLTWLLAWTAALAILHVLLAALRGRLPVSLFCLLGALASTAAGLWALWDTILENARRSLGAAVLWWPGFALGFFVAGALGALAWAAATVGLARLLRGPERESET